MLPAAAMFEVALAAARQIKSGDPVTLRNARLQGPCLLEQDRPVQLQTIWRSDRRMLELASRDVDETTWQSLLTIDLGDDAGGDIFDPGALAAARERCEEPFTGEACYAWCENIGLRYGPRYRGLQQGVWRTDEVIAEVTLPAEIADEAESHGVHPALLDSCFHGVVVAEAGFQTRNNGLFLPVQLRELQFLKPTGTSVITHVRITQKTGERVIADIDVLDESGEPCLLLRGFESKRVGARESAATVHDLVYAYRWQESESPEITPDANQRRWCVFGDHSGLGERLCRSMSLRGWDLVRVLHGDGFCQLDADSFVVNPQVCEDFDQLLQAIMPGASPVTDVVYLWANDVPDNIELTPESLERSTVLTTLAPLYLAQAWERADESRTARLTLVTTGAQSPDDPVEPVQVGQAPLTGFGRVIISELSRLDSKLVDLPNGDADQAAEDLLIEIASRNDDEDEVMIRSGKRLVHRFVQQFEQPIARKAAATLPSRLQVGRAAGVEELNYRTTALPSPGPYEVEIEVAATGLNFSDVMKSLGLYPGLPDGPVALGAECAGRITHVGRDVKQWQVGDEVIAIAQGGFATHVVVNAEMVATKPANLSHQQAATIPIAFLTAQYALCECARMQSGDRVLIHSASGGVGLAAMQLARIADVTIFATAGNEEKRDFVRNLGADKVMDSRSVAFADQTLQATAGEGVDIILNSLPGEAITRGLSILKTGGRFLEIGKRDIYSDTPLGLAPFRNNLAFFAIDLDQLFQQQPRRMGDMLRALVPRFESGTLTPLPVTTYSADQTRDAFRFMQQGKHIGKISVDYRDPPDPILPGTLSPVEFRRDGTYWIAGGLGGFGLQVARWLAGHGADHIVLGGRTDTVGAAAQQVIDEITATGTQVTVMPADITRPEEVRRVIDEIDDHLPELRGVFHTAMVLEDRMLADLDRKTLERVLRPKVLGGWNLHSATSNRDLDHFVLFSSLSSVFGHAGQANYSAANALLDGLAHYRRAQGLPAAVINWGYLADAGYLAERPQLGERLQRQGVLSFTVEEATEALEYALQTRALQMSVLRMDWSVWRGLGITSKVSPRFAHLLRGSGKSAESGQPEQASLEEIRSASALDRIEMIRVILAERLATLLGIEEHDIEGDRSLLQFGLDSLMAVEMRNWIESRLAINLPISSLMQSSGLDQLVETVCEMLSEPEAMESLRPQTESMRDTITSDRADVLLDQLPDMADDEVTNLLGQLLRRQEGG